MDQAIKFKWESEELLSKAQFELKGREVGPVVEDEHAEERSVQVLGLSWNLKDVNLSCDLRGTEKYEKGPATKRKILALAHMIFDPLGFTCPFTIIPKMLLQEAWNLKTG